MKISLFVKSCTVVENKINAIFPDSSTISVKKCSPHYPLPFGTHQDAVVHPHQAALPHLEAELALAPGVTRPQLRRPRVLVQDHRPLDGNPGLLHGYVHGQIEELGVPVLHPALGEQHEDELTAGHVLGHDHGLVLDVRGQALGVHLEGDPHPGPLTAGVRGGAGGVRDHGWTREVGHFSNLQDLVKYKNHDKYKSMRTYLP